MGLFYKMRDNLINCLTDYHVRYVSILATMTNWIKNWDKRYFFLTLKEIKKKIKKNDTIFVLGGSETINNITEKQWNFIAKHDSIGINWWPVHEFIPTYYYSNYPRNKTHFKNYKRIIGRRAKRYKNKTIFLISGNRAVK